MSGSTGRSRLTFRSRGATATPGSVVVKTAPVERELREHRGESALDGLRMLVESQGLQGRTMGRSPVLGPPSTSANPSQVVDRRRLQLARRSGRSEELEAAHPVEHLLVGRRSPRIARRSGMVDGSSPGCGCSRTCGIVRRRLGNRVDRREDRAARGPVGDQVTARLVDHERLGEGDRAAAVDHVPGPADLRTPGSGRTGTEEGERDLGGGEGRRRAASSVWIEAPSGCVGQAPPASRRGSPRPSSRTMVKPGSSKVAAALGDLGECPSRRR